MFGSGGEIEAIVYRAIESMTSGRRSSRHGLVTSYDPKKHLAKVMYQPEGFESGWLPIQTGHIGQEYGIAIGLQPGSGMGDLGGGGAGGGEGGGGGSSGGPGGGQAQGDQVQVDFQEGDIDAGKIVMPIHSKVDNPPQVQSGEMVFYSKFKKDKDSGQDADQTGSGGTGLKVFFKQDGSLNLEDGYGGQHFFDGKGNVTGNATKVMTHRIVDQRDSSPFSSLTDDEQSDNPQTIHHTTYDKQKGVTTGAFQDQHKSTWDQNGVTHTSSNMVTSTAPKIPHNGNVYNSENVFTTGSDVAGTQGTTSDVRLKINIEDLPPMLDIIMGLRPKQFDKFEIGFDEDGIKGPTGKPRPSRGFIAQELREHIPTAVHGDEERDYLNVDNLEVTASLIAAFQEYVAKTDKRIAELEARLQG